MEAVKVQHHVRIRKARGLWAALLRMTGRGLWTVRCHACPGLEFPTTRSHDQAVTMAALHMRTTWPGLLSTDLILDQETADRIRREVMAYAARLDRKSSGPATPPEGVSSHSEQDDFR